MSGEDGFWARVRSVLGRGPAVPAYGRSGIGSPEKKPRPAQRIEEELRRGWAYAASHNVSLCVLAMEMDGYAAYFSAYGRDAVEDALDRLDAVIRKTISRPNAECLRSGRSGFLLILPDMPALMARELAARLAVAVRHEGIVNRESHAGQVTLSMGLAVANPRGELDRNVLNTAVQSVRRAQRRGIARLEVTDLRVLAAKQRKAA